MGADLYRSGETFELTMRIGIDLGGTKIEGILMDREGNVTQVIRLAAPENNTIKPFKQFRNLFENWMIKRALNVRLESVRLEPGFPTGLR